MYNTLAQLVLVYLVTTTYTCTYSMIRYICIPTLGLHSLILMLDSGYDLLGAPDISRWSNTIITHIMKLYS